VNIKSAQLNISACHSNVMKAYFVFAVLQAGVLIFQGLIFSFKYDFMKNNRNRMAHNLVLLRVPNHVAFIVDGNGRWATNQNLSRTEGHKAGASTTIEIVKSSYELGVNTVTLFLFSTENWKRPQVEISNIMDLLERKLVMYMEYFTSNRISVKFIGNLRLLPASVQVVLRTVEQLTRSGTRTLCLAISYGGRDDIIQVS